MQGAGEAFYDRHFLCVNIIKRAWMERWRQKWRDGVQDPFINRIH